MGIARNTASLVLILAASGAGAAERADRVELTHFLSLVQGIMSVAAAAPAGDPRVMDRAMEDVLTGRNPDANALAERMFRDFSASDRDQLASIARSMAALARRDAAFAERASGDAAAIDARKDLTAMGLVYHDERQFLDAVRRGDAIAVRLYLAARGVDPGAKDTWGRSARELAERAGHAEIASMLDGATARR